MEFVPQSWRRETALSDGRVVVLPPIKEKELVEPVSQWGEPGTGAALGYGGGGIRAKGLGQQKVAGPLRKSGGPSSIPEGAAACFLACSPGEGQSLREAPLPRGQRVMRPGACGTTQGLSQPLGSAPRPADSWQA